MEDRERETDQYPAESVWCGVGVSEDGSSFYNSVEEWLGGMEGEFEMLELSSRPHP